MSLSWWTMSSSWWTISAWTGLSRITTTLVFVTMMSRWLRDTFVLFWSFGSGRADSQIKCYVTSCVYGYASCVCVVCVQFWSTLMKSKQTTGSGCEAVMEVNLSDGPGVPDLDNLNFALLPLPMLNMGSIQCLNFRALSMLETGAGARCFKVAVTIFLTADRWAESSTIVPYRSSPSSVAKPDDAATVSIVITGTNEQWINAGSNEVKNLRVTLPRERLLGTRWSRQSYSERDSQDQDAEVLKGAIVVLIGELRICQWSSNLQNWHLRLGLGFLLARTQKM